MANRIEVEYAVHFRGATEDYSDIEPKVLKKSIFLCLKILLHHIMGKHHGEEYYGLHYDASVVDIFKTMIRSKPDLVVVRGKAVTERKACFVAKILGISRVLYNQEPYYKAKITRIKKVLKKIYNFSVPNVRYTPVKVPEYSMLKQLDRFVVYPNTYYLPFAGIMVEEAENRDYLGDGIVNFLMVGKFREYKNHRLLVDAMAEISDKNNCRLTFLGQCSTNGEKSYLDALKDYVVQKGLNGIVNYVANIDPAQMKEYYMSHDVLILPTKREDASISVIEAMHHGLSVISTSRNGTASYIAHGESGFIFESEDKDSLKECIEEYLKDLTRVEKMGKCALLHSNKNASRQAYFSAFREMMHKEFPKLKI